MCPSHLVTIAETDRGAVGQSGVGVLNELSWIQSACVSRGMDEWPDSLSTSLFLYDFPALYPDLLPLPLFPFQTFSPPPPLPPSKSSYCVFFIYFSLQPLFLTVLFSCLLSPCFFYSFICLCPQFSSFSHFPSQLFESCFFFQQWTALRLLQLCFHSERWSTYALR